MKHAEFVDSCVAGRRGGIANTTSDGAKHPHARPNPSIGIVGLSGILAAVIFAFDVSMPLGVAGAIPYVALVLLGWWAPWRPYVPTLAVCATALTVLGYALSPAGGVEWVVLSNRALAIFAIWVTAILTYNRKLAMVVLADAREALEQKILARTADVREAMRALEESEARYRLLVELSPDAILVVRDGRIIFANARALVHFRAPNPLRLLGMAALDLTHPDDRARVLEYRAAIENAPGVETRLELRQVRLDGTILDAETLAARVDWNGAPATMIATRDISKRRRAEEALRESEERFRNFTEAASDWAWETDKNHRFSFVSGGSWDVGAIERLDVVGRTRWEIAGGDATKDESWVAHLADLNGRRPFRDFYYGYVDSDGHAYHSKVSGKPVFDQAGEFVGYRGVGSDVSAKIAARRRAEDAEARLMDAIESLPDGFVFFDADGKLVLCNEKFREMYREIADRFIPGASFKELTRATVEKGLIAGALGREEEWQAARLMSHRELRTDTEYQLSNGRRIRVSERRTRDGGTVGIRTDITERKRAEDELRASEERYRMLVELSPEAIIVNDGTRNVFANTAAARLHGADSPDELIGVHWLDLIHPDDRERARCRTDRLIETGEPSATETRRCLRLDGSEILVETMAAPITWRGKPAILGILRDLTDQRRAEANLRRSQASLANAQRIAQLGDWGWNIETGEVTWSDQNYRIFGFQPREFGVTYAGFLDLVHPDDRASVDRAMQMAVREKSPYTLHYRIVRPDGEERVVQELAELELDDTGQPLRMFGTIQDVTEAKRTEARLHELQAQLFRVSRLNAMGQVSTAIAHELNQPLAAIGNYVQACRRMMMEGRGGGSDEIEEMMTKAVEQVDRAGAIVRGLGGFVKRTDSVRSWVNLNQAINEALSLGLIGTAETGVRVSEDFAADLPAVLIDKVPVQQVIVNLVRNAVEAMTDSERRELAVTTSLNAAGEAEVAVRDTGPGLPDEVAERLFQPFVTSKPGGMGIGLSISHSIVEAHGGRLWAAPNSGGGTSFQFTLPVTTNRGPSHGR